MKEVQHLESEWAGSLGIVALHYFFYCATYGLFLVLFVLEMIYNLIERKVVHYCDTSCIFYNLEVVVQSEQKGPKCLHADLAEAKGTLGSNWGIWIFTHSLNENKFPMSSKVLDAQNCTLPDTDWFVFQALVKEWQ